SRPGTSCQSPAPRLSGDPGAGTDCAGPVRSICAAARTAGRSGVEHRPRDRSEQDGRHRTEIDNRRPRSRQRAGSRGGRLSFRMFLPNTGIEVIQADFPRGEVRAALFDFDGTLSLIREGWPDVMIPMMVQHLERTPAAEARDELGRRVEEFVMRLNGKQT